VGAAPKTKVSRHRRGNRRQNQRLTAPTLVLCNNCGLLMRAHHVCKACGFYRQRQVVVKVLLPRVGSILFITAVVCELTTLGAPQIVRPQEIHYNDKTLG